MEEKKIIRVEAREDGFDEVNAELSKTKKNLDQVEDSSKKAGTGLKDVGENGGAISVLDSLTGGLATRIRDAAEASKLFNFNLKATKAALLATGIGAFVVVLGTVVAYWDDIVDFINQTNKKLEEQLAKIQRKGELLEGQLAVVQAEEDLLKAQGKATDEIIDKKRTLLQAQIGIQGAELATLQAQREQLRIELARDQIRRGYIDRLSGGLLSGGTVDTGPLADLDKQISELTVKVRGAQTALFALSNGQQTDESGNIVETRGEDQEKVSVITGLPLAQLQTDLEIETGMIQEYADRQRSIAKTTKEFNVMMAKEESMAKMQVLMQFGQFLQDMGENSKALLIAGIVAEQAASISQIITATGIANAKAVAASPITAGQPWVGINTASAAISIASGIASAVKAISGVRSANGNSSIGGFSSLPQGAGGAPQIQEPAFNIVGDSRVNQLIDVISEREGKPVRAYVVSDDVRSQSELDRNIRASSTI